MKKVEPKLNLNEKLKTEITNILKSKNKQFQFIEETIDYSKLTKFEKPNSDKKYSKKDFRNFKTTNNVDEIMIIKVKYGILVSYYGMIELEKEGYINIGTQIIDLSDNSLLQQENFQSIAQINGNWQKGIDFENLKNSIQKAINNSIITLKTKF